MHVVHAFGTGGLEKGIASLVRGASTDFHHVVLCLDRSGDSARLLPGGTAVIEMRKSPGNSPIFLWRLARRLRALRPDIVHTRNWGGIDGILASWLAGLRGVVHGEHGWSMEDPYGTSRRRIRVRRFTARWVREYTAVSQGIARWLADEVSVNRPVTQIYNGVDTDEYRPGKEKDGARAELGIRAGTFVVGIVGRLDPIKDHAGLFQAFSRLCRSRPDSVLLVVGDGPERRRLAESAPAGVRILGSRTDVPALLRAMDLFVLSSLNEGISNTILEAMASGLPVVATRVGGNPELVEDGVTGTLVEPADPEALAAALERYSRNPDSARDHGRAGRARALRRFSVRSMIDSYEAVWRRAAGISR